ncbi:hypothetical protein M431DRAFT_282217 [Trichoderma harzianum CBS 226.95]|uniref:Uncharacterized protein n=1 Tax=Trichoderma harzianum CBS 226.95 TaxID=983964 RepID=A0A2T4ANK4_TRIHA|nr:hypothetical protein M431DRAFT_282217 [Trichoderma harzianum CBS 226.95]PTB58647.1 hypothetical protein M431DRAFT_282217 [Trichoderma harzianum CBS 226.95]
MDKKPPRMRHHHQGAAKENEAAHVAELALQQLAKEEPGSVLSAVQCFIGHTDFWATICWEGQNLFFFSFFQARFRHTQGPRSGQSRRITCRAALTCVELLLRCLALLCVPVQQAHGRIDFWYKPQRESWPKTQCTPHSCRWRHWCFVAWTCIILSS